MLLALPFSITSCGDDEPEANDSISIIGKWTSNAKFDTGGGETITYLPNGMEDITTTPGKQSEGTLTLEFYSDKVCGVSYLDYSIGYEYIINEKVITFTNSYGESCSYNINFDKSNLSLSYISGDTSLGTVRKTSQKVQEDGTIFSVTNEYAYVLESTLNFKR